MVKIYILKCTKGIDWGKHGSFIEGNTYYGRMSKSHLILIRDESNRWIIAEDFKLHTCGTIWKDNFEIIGETFVKTHKEAYKYGEIQRVSKTQLASTPILYGN